MEHLTRNIKTVKEDGFNLTSEYNIGIVQTEKKYNKLINKSFKKNIKIDFEKVIQFKRVQKILKGQILYKPSPNSTINISISSSNLECNFPVTILEITDQRITANYLLWFLDHNEVKEYLLCHSIGAIFNSIPVEAFYKLKVPLPKADFKYLIKELTFENKISSFRLLINQYYQQYSENLSNGNFMTCAILAGSIAESFLHNFLLEIGIQEKSLERKTLGGLIELLDVFLINSDIKDFPIVEYKGIQHLRNTAVHPKLAKDKIEREEEFGLDDFKCFNQIVKYFGL